MQKEKIDIPFFKYWKFTLYYKLRIHKATEWSTKVIEKLDILCKLINNNGFNVRKIITYVFSGFSIIFIGYLLLNVMNNYPPRIIGINP